MPRLLAIGVIAHLALTNQVPVGSPDSFWLQPEMLASLAIALLGIPYLQRMFE